MTTNSRNKYLREEYTSRINRVIDYIEINLNKDLSLQELAGVANFSPFHFHRIFSAIIGETLNDFIQRIRLEKAASKLVLNPKISITEIALEFGFSGSATFARAFKDSFKMSASEWRAGGYLEDRKISKEDSKERQGLHNNRKEFQVSSMYTIDETYNFAWRVEMKGNSQLQARVEVKDIPEMTIAYIRHIGPYEGDAELFGRLFEKLMMWAGPRGLIRPPETKIMTVYYDNPDITDKDKLRVDAYISVPEDTQVDGEIGKSKIPAGKYAIAHFEVKTEQFGDAWNAVYGGWLPESGYQPADGPCFEMYYNDHREHPEGKHIFDIGVPVKPL